MTTAARPVLVHLSPLPESRSGIAGYAAAILLRLARDYECICVVEDPDSVIGPIRDVAHVLSHAEYDRIAADLAGERHLAHLGNNGNHVAILDALSRVPAVVVLHDPALFYLLECWAQERFGHPGDIAPLVRMWHGATAADLVAAKFDRRHPVQSIYIEVSGLALLQQTASALITHSHYARVLATAADFTGPVRVIPHYAEIPAEDQRLQQRAAFRARHGAGPDTVLFASLGFVTPNKQIAAALAALAALPPGLDDWLYVIGGENRDPEVAPLIQQLGLGDRVILFDYLAEADFDGIMAAADVVINLRQPTWGETSGTVSRALAYGLPCIVTDHGWYAELPQAATYRVRPGPETTADLHRALLRCLIDPDERRAMGAAARAHAAAELALDIVVAAYRDVIEETQTARAAAGTGTDAGRTQVTARPMPLFAPQRLRMLDGPADAADLLADLLAGERAWCEGGSTRRILLAAPGPGFPAGLAASLTGEDAGGDAGAALTQAFATLALGPDTGFGGLVNLAQDAAAVLGPDDLLTLAILMPATFAPDLPGAFRVMRPYLAPGMPADRLVGDILAQAGFVVLRQTEAIVPAPDLAPDLLPELAPDPVPGFPPDRGAAAQVILTMTLRRISAAAPQLALFG